VEGSEANKNSVPGDTVSEPLKDTFGPALNIFMKLMAIISLVYNRAIAEFSTTVRPALCSKLQSFMSGYKVSLVAVQVKTVVISPASCFLRCVTTTGAASCGIGCHSQMMHTLET
jgi:hypothetical protein